MTVAEPRRLYVHISTNSAVEGKDLMVCFTIVLMLQTDPIQNYKLDSTGAEHNQYLQAVWSLTLFELNTLQHMDLKSLSQAPLSSSPSTNDRID